MCKMETVVTAARYAAPALRQAPKRRIDLLLDNVRSAQNVGAILRTASSIGVTHAYLCGITAPGDHALVKKASLGADATVPWSSHRDAYDLFETSRPYTIALECCEQAVPWPLALAGIAAAAPVLLVIGHEVAGIDPMILSQCDVITALPMAGEKNSLNVGHAFAIAGYQLAF
jgi:23S rRNA (guanosine2251-2'-O)-methyltransferase